MKWLIFLLFSLTLTAKEPDPITQVKQWCKEEKERTEGRFFKFASLATVSPTGTPHIRMIEIVHFHKEKGALFFTHQNTRKVADITHTPLAALNLWLPKTHRQLILEGSVEKIENLEAEKSWNRMPRYMKLSFLASHHAGALDSIAVLEERKEALKKTYPKEIPCPQEFVGYRLVPNQITFYEVCPRFFPEKGSRRLER
ncbi:MAG: pyridoxamine 5'-phosphate oxidase family protein [Chlamydiia bacterium]|nr:pyridoxamine 5'-phosphate oxidase family protein [Chlamydiia bacterium]